MDIYFESVAQLKTQLMDSLKGHVPNKMEFHVGYIEPSKQGIRGKMRWIFSEEDLKDMYTAYTDKSEIILWCDGQRQKESETHEGRKRPNSEASSTSAPKKGRSLTVEQTKKLSDVQEIYEKLDTEHHG